MIVKTRTLFLTGAALALLAASEASAVPMYCTTGSLNACASVVVEKYGDMVMVRVRNLQGQVAEDNTWYSGIRSLQLYMRGVQGFSDFSMTTEGSVNTLGPAGSWSATQYGPGWLYLYAIGGSAGIVGCNTGEGARSNLGYYQTCADDSWVVFTFRTKGHWDPSQLKVQWHIDAYDSPTGFAQSVTCDPRLVGPGCAEHETHTTPPQWIVLFEGETPANVTPEPVTLALLGTGLAGVGAAARRRRKQQQSGDGV